MSLLNIGGGKFINIDRVSYIKAMNKDLVVVRFQDEPYPGNKKIPGTYLQVEGDDAERLLRWLEANTERIGS